MRSAKKSLPNLAYSCKEKLDEMAQPPRRPQPDRKGAVFPLYGLPENTGNKTNDHTDHTTLERQQSDPINVSKIKTLLENMSNTPEEDTHVQPQPRNYKRSFSYNGGSTWVRVGGYIQGSNFTLRVNSNQQNTQTYSQSARVREVDSTPYKRESDSNVFQEISDSNSMFEIEIERSMESTCTGNSYALNVQLTFSTEVDHNVNYLVLQQEAGSNQWQDITETHATIQNPRKIDIPVKRSSKIWVIRLKKSFSSLKHALLARIHGKILFHILVYFMKKTGRVKVRIIGISEELYQNPKHLRTSVTIAEEDQFQKCPEVPPKLLVKKGYLNVVVRKNGDHVDSRQFDIRGSNELPDWFDCSFSTNELKENLEVKVTDREGNVQWSLDLNEVLYDDSKSIKQVGSEDISKPEITMGLDDEVCERHIPWLARHLNKDVEKVARGLRVDSDEIDAMTEPGERAETRNIKILDFWRKKTLGRGNKPRWNQIKTVLECENVGRFDIIRCLQNEEEIDNEVFLWLEQRVASFCCHYARVLGVPDHEVNMINETGHSCEQRCTLLLKRWRQRTPNPKVEDLIEALEHDTMKKNELANEMRQKFGKEG